MRNRGGPFSLLFGLQEGEAGVAVFRLALESEQ